MECEDALMMAGNGSAVPDPSQPPASGLVGGRRVVWIEAWEPCSEGDACARNVGYFATEQGGGSPLATQLTPQKPRNTAQFRDDEFNRCVKELFKTEYKGGNFFRDGLMEFYGYSKDAKSMWDFSDRDGHFKITTDHDTYSTGELKAIVCPLGCPYEVVGLTKSDSKLDGDYNFTNYIGSDVVGMPNRFSKVFVWATWVHEIGNALKIITGNMPELPADWKERYGHQDAGVALEDCVFEGKVTPHGGLDHP